MPYAAGLDFVDIITQSQSVEVPGNAERVEIWAVGAGGSGSTGLFPAGGGAGGIAYAEFTVIPGDWGTTLTLVVGTGAVDAAGGNTTVDGALNGASFATLTGGGGGKAGVPSAGAGGAGGDATGGTLNVPGVNGQDYDAENDIAGLGAEISDPDVESFVSAEVFGRGGDGDAGTQFAGSDGVIIIWWRN